MRSEIEGTAAAEGAKGRGFPKADSDGVDRRERGGGGGTGAWVERRRHGKRPHVPCQWINEVMFVLGEGERGEILQLLANGPMCVSAIAKAMVLSEPATSRHLKALEIACLVIVTRVKTWRFYGLSDRVKAFRQGDMTQLIIKTDSGHWVLLHIDESADADAVIDPPDGFVGRRRNSKS